MVVAEHWKGVELVGCHWERKMRVAVLVKSAVDGCKIQVEPGDYGGTALFLMILWVQMDEMME
jgi:hypothetical protein